MATDSGTTSGLVERFTRGERPALARAISIVENQRTGFEDLLETLHARVGRSHRIGITGPPGAGKSTLTASLAKHWRSQKLTVGIVAVDPTSPFTGGALLGDRIRMNDLVLDDGIFIRSMATRGALGGLALTTKETADVMDAFGFDRIILETVGVGQSELDIASAADTTVVVLVPESGDGIQAMKAGLMEASDIFVINKSDRPGADKLAREISLMLHLRHGRALRSAPAHHGVDLRNINRKLAKPPEPDGEAGASHAEHAGPADWSIPVLKTVAENGTGVPELADTILRHEQWLDETGARMRRREARLRERVRELLARQLDRAAWGTGPAEAMLTQNLPRLQDGTLSPYALAASIARELLSA